MSDFIYNHSCDFLYSFRKVEKKGFTYLILNLIYMIGLALEYKKAGDKSGR